MQCSVFNLPFQNTIYTSNNCSNVVRSSSLILSSFFVGVLENKTPGAALELQQLSIEQFSQGILKFGIKQVINHLTLNC